MKEILLIEAADWTLSLSAPDQAQRYTSFRRTLEKRRPGRGLPASSIGFSEKLSVTLGRFQNLEDTKSDWVEENYQDFRIELPCPLLFDNTSYQFCFTFEKNSGVSKARVEHRLRRIAEAFTLLRQRQSQSFVTLVGTIKTGNNVGSLVLPLSYESNSRKQAIAISFDVFSAKLSTNDDLKLMYQSIDQVSPFLRFRVARPTEQKVSRGRSRGYFPVMWLAQFERLRTSLDTALKVVVNAPHNRLQHHVRYVRADRLRGRVGYRVAEKVRNDLACGLENKRYRQTSKQLNMDTPENRFVKMVITRSAVTLTKLHKQLSEEKERTGKRIISDPFLENVSAWATDMQMIKHATFLAEVGSFSGMKNESLVLQQRPGYSRVYAVWQELQYYLNMFDRSTSIAMCSIDKIYEIWCFLEVRRILMEDLKFTEIVTKKSRPATGDDKLEEGAMPSQEFRFHRKDGVSVCLTHEPVFQSESRRRYSLKAIRTYRLEQKPDIFLRAEYADGRQCIWLFDAKYRLDSKSEDGKDSVARDDLVPDDALHQMHRYRDALIHEEADKDSGFRTKTRVVMAAFALYPGYFNQSDEDNPYEELIEEVGIGAFSLLPSIDGSEGRHWLTTYLRTQLGSATSTEYLQPSTSDHLYVQEPARIPFFGMHQNLHRKLVLVAGLGANRTKDYVEAFAKRSAKWYHCPVATFDSRYEEHVVRELEYLAIAVLDEEQAATFIDYVWPIVGLYRMPRKNISPEQAGVLNTSSDATSYYWLFKLGSPQRLNDPVPGFPRSGFIEALRVTTLSDLSRVTHYTQLQDVYGHAISR